MTKDVASLIVETVTEGHNYKVTKDNYQFYLERRTTLPVVQTENPIQTTSLPVATAHKQKQLNSLIQEVMIQRTMVLWNWPLMAGLGLTVSNRKSKEQ